MSLTTRIQDQKDHITQVKKDLCSKVGIPSEPLPSFSEIMGSVPSPSLSDIIKFDIPETYQDGISYNFQAFNRPWVKICGPNQLISDGFSTDWVGKGVNKYWVGILRKTDETNNKDYHYCFFQTSTSYQVYLLAWDENSQRYRNFGPLYSNYVASSSDNIQFGFFNYNGNIYIMYQVKGKDATSDYWSTFILNNIGQIDKVFPKEKYGILQ